MEETASAPPAYTECSGENKSGDTSLQLDAANDVAVYPPAYTGHNNIPPEYTNEPPPAYDTLILGKVQKLKDESNGQVDFARNLFMVAFCGTLCSGISIAITFAVPIASMVIGVVYLEDCPAERFIPIYLVVSGAFGLTKAMCVTGRMIVRRVKSRNTDENGEEEEETPQRKPDPVDTLISCFLLAWFIAGSVWVYRIYKDVQTDDPMAGMYCEATCYQFAFWLLTATYIVFAVLMCCCCGVGAVGCCIAAKDSMVMNRETTEEC